MIQLVNPIPEQIKDPKELGDFLEKYSIVPYFGNGEETSHYMMKLIKDLSALSPSHIACKNDIAKYTFSHEVSLIQRTVPGLKKELTPLSQPEEDSAIQWLNDRGIALDNLITASRRLFKDFSDSGNAYLHIKVVKVGGTTRVFFDVVNYTQAAYLATKPLENKHIIVTEKWDEDWWTKKPPLVLPASEYGKPFNWKGGSTVTETIVHIKNDGIWYGTPPVLPIMFWMYVEFAQSDAAVKIGSTDFITKKIIAFEEVNPARFKGGAEDKAADFRKKMRVLKKLTTNEGDFGEASSLAGIEYPYEGKAPTTIDLEINRDTTYANFILDRASRYVYSIHGWYRQLTGDIEMKAGLGSDLIKNLFNMANVSTVLPQQAYWRNFWAATLAQVAEVTSSEVEFTINFDSLITQLLTNLTEVEATEEMVEEEIEDEVKNNEENGTDDTTDIG